MVTGSYDCTCKVWSRSDWSLLHTIRLHNDSVWEVKLKQRLYGISDKDAVAAAAALEGDRQRSSYTFATAGLDG